MRDEWKNALGMTVKAFGLRGGFFPGNKARIFDTANPGTNNENGDPDLGSPNRQCGGPGRGKAGQPGERGENCVPQGNVLIIQESDKEFPDDNLGGGSLCFEFDSPTFVLTLGVLDISEEGDYIHLTYADNTMEKRDVFGYGNNALQTFKIEEKELSRLCLQLKSSGAITHIALCQDGVPSLAPSVTPMPSSSVVPSSVPTVSPAPSISPGPTATFSPTTFCEEYVVVDFETAGNGTALEKGEYVQDEWLEEYFFRITARSTILGFTPGGKARIFDTGNPGETQRTGDPDLGSPHR